MIDNLLCNRQAQDAEVKFMQITGTSFAQCLSGGTDAIQFLFGAYKGPTGLSAMSNKSSTVL